MAQVDQPLIQRENRPIRSLGVQTGSTENVENINQLNVLMTAGAENAGAHTIAVVIQAREYQTNLSKVVPLRVWTSESAYGAAVVNGNGPEFTASVGVLVVEWLANAGQDVLTDANGTVTITITDTGTDDIWLHCQLPTGDISYVKLTYAA